MYQVGMSTPLSVSVPPTKLSVSGTAEQLIKIKLNKYIRLLSSRSIAVMANTYHNETCRYGHGCLQKRLGTGWAKRHGVPLFQELPSDMSTVHLENTAVFI